VEEAGASDEGGLSDDDRLMLRVASGDQAALAKVIDRHGRGLRLFAARMLGGSGDAEDVVQEVYLAAWRHAARFDPARGRATIWLYRIAANRCVDMRRRRSFRAFVGLETIRDDAADDAPATDRQVGTRQELALVRRRLAGLPERQRMALLLRAVADMDVPDIASVMGVSIGSAEQLLVRARRALREHMESAAKTSEDRAGSV
jgi:RNA polymerase sigma-70 factor (ECF subfamily)